MSAPEGNKFWMKRATHGREKIFTTPQAMWEAACEYFTWCEDHPLYSTEWKNGKDGLEEKKTPKMRAFTLMGLCLFMDVHTKYFNDFEASIKEAKPDITPEKKQEQDDFSNVITRIRDTIYNQKFEGAASGFLNHNIIARDLGLRDHTFVQSNNVNTNHETPVDFSSMTYDEIQKVLADIERLRKGPKD